jgi:hypothetical protein
MTIKLPDTEQLIKNQHKLDDLGAAMSLVDAEIQKETRIANNKLIESVSPEITRLGSAWAKAFIEGHAKHLEFDEYINVLEDLGASVGQFRIRPNGLSHPKDRSGNYFYAVKEFIESKFLTQSDMPKVLR